ncbi:MAG: Gfo/Idh/MocA family oxidoreductase [Ilumatobacteraceae bacterium]|nr:Gfo/Idh/MocA family oxidoreductase [Ilumatobacteraceae bacterium]
MKVRVGVVGLGRVSSLHLAAYAAMPHDVTVAAVSDADPARAASVADAYGAHAVRFDEMLADPSIDAIEILVPSPSQPEMALAAIRSGKHVTVQKPLAGDLATAEALVVAAEASSRKFRVFENTLNAPSWLLAEQLIHDGTIGRPLSISMRWTNSLLPRGWDVPADAWAWRHRGAWAEQFAAPALFDDSAHMLSPAIALFGEVGDVVALTGRQRVGEHVTGFPYAIAWHHVDGGQATVDGTLCEDLEVLTEQYASDTSLSITGSAGVLWINTGEGRVAERPTVEVASGGVLRAFDVDHRWSTAWHVAQQEWIAAIRDDSPFRWTGRQALAVLRGSLKIDAAVRAAQLRRAT